VSALPKLPCYYHPSTVLLVDDNPTFLNNMKLALNFSYRYRCCHESKKVVDIVETAPKFEIMTLLQSLEGMEESDVLMQYLMISINLAPIYQQLTNVNRNAELSVLVVDYIMPGIDGLSLCRALVSHPIKKIMITGKADYRFAVNAFNEGVIDQFILKEAEDFYEQLNDAIERLQQQYFIDRSKSLMTLLNTIPNFCLAAEPISQFVAHYINEHSIREYYLIDSCGSYLLIDEAENSHILVLQNASFCQNNAKIAIENEADQTVIEALEQCQQLLFL
jgi:DNA-binding NtrC family response regulator